MSEIIKVNFVQGRDYLQDVALYANEAANAAANAKTSENNAQSAANQAAQSANQASQSALTAQDAKTQTVIYANAAKGYAESAQSNATIASDAATIASSQANNTAILVDRAENAVAGIDAMSAPAWDATTVYSYPKVVAYTDGYTYRCIGTNVAAGTTPDTSKDWIRISVLGGDDFFDVDMQGSLMPAVNPTFSYSWQLDSNGNIMPRATSDTLGTAINTFAEQALTTANKALARANTIIYEGIPVELDSAGNVTTTDESL